MSSTRALLLFLAVIVCFENVRAFNFDTDFPIVYLDPYSSAGVPLAKSSYFGYSVLLYEGSRDTRPWIQIAAPRGANSYARNETTGVVFRCGIKFPCYHLPMNPVKDDSYSAEAYFGNSMDISGNKEIYAVCGHRWIAKNSKEYYIQGACFAGKTNDNETDFFRPLYKQGGQTELVGGVRIYNKAQAQLGFSAQFSKQGNELLVGMPGLLNWKGAPGLLFKPGSPEPARRRGKRSIDDLLDSLVPDAITIDEIKYFDLAGYSVASGHFYQRGGLYFATGAPRASQKGSVLVFQFNNPRLVVRERKDGSHIGEYFGSSLAVANINADEYDDLVVGAPFHKGTGSDMKYDSGAIYIYLGSKDKLLDAATNVIEGKTTGGRFGEALMALGDIDKDGCQDIAVAAPYENENSGVVYIFRGDRRLGLLKEPSQIISGRDILPEIRGFGISMSKPADIDGNSYNDLAIGAYRSGHGVLLRAKPVVVLDHVLTSSVSQISAQNHTSAFNISSCVSFSGEHINPPIDIVRTLSVDKGVADRAYLDGATNLESRMTVQNEKYCQIYTVRIRESNKNIYDPIVVRASVDLKKLPVNSAVITVTDRVDGLDGFCKGCAILRTTEETAKQISIDFNRGCGDDNICDSRLSLSSKFPELSEGVYVVGSKDYVTMEATVGNSMENAFQTEISITLPNPVRLKRMPPFCIENAAQISCTIDNPLKKDATRTVSLELDLDEVNTGKYQNELDFVLRVRTSSNNDGESEKRLQLKLVKNADLELIGKSSEETYSYINRTYGAATFQQIFKILKYDISPIQKARLRVEIPTTLAFEGREVKLLSLYSPHGTLAGQAITCKTDIETITDEDVPAATGDQKKRKRRDVPTVEELLAKYPANRTIYFNCSSEGVTCGRVSCDVGPFKNAKNVAEVKFKMVLNISQLTNYQPEKDIVIVSTNAELEISDTVIHENKYSHKVTVPSVFIGPSAEKSVATWIIIVAIICGILLLLVVAGILYKLGFFERKKKDLLMEEKAKQNTEGQSDPLHTEDNM